MIIGQSPGVHEVEQGLPFVGDSGALLDAMLECAELERNDVYIANALKCHPPMNRPGTQEELNTCMDEWLKHEIQQVQPKIVLVLGRDAFNALRLPQDKWGHENVIIGRKRKYLVSYHPAYFLRRQALEDFINVGELLRKELDA